MLGVLGKPSEDVVPEIAVVGGGKRLNAEIEQQGAQPQPLASMRDWRDPGSGS
jgi:hypothetical protein